MATINEIQDEIIEEFAGFDDWMDKYQLLIDLGNEQEPLDEQYKTESNLIDGCQSRVWLQADYDEGYGCESWTIKKAEHQRIDAFELWCWRRFLRVSWTARRSNQFILKEISPEYSLEGLILKMQLQYSCPENSMYRGVWQAIVHGVVKSQAQLSN